MAGTGVVDAFLVYQFVRRLATPFNKWEAFKTGVIDDKGKIITPPKERTAEQKKSFKLYDVMLLNMKKLLAKIPGGSSRIATFAAALWLLNEEYETLEYDTSDAEIALSKIQTWMEPAQDLMEDAPANAVGAGHIAGARPGEDPPIRRFAGARVFQVDLDRIYKCRMGKYPYHRYSRYVGEDDVGEEIRQYCRSNPKEDVILQDGATGGMVFLRRRRP